MRELEIPYLVQIGFAGDCFVAFDEPDTPTSILRGQSRVLVATPRGVEMGVVMSKIDTPMSTADLGSSRLKILRSVTRDDALLIDRLQKYKTDAVRKCQDVLAASKSEAVLLDVDQLFDGNALVLHFLGPVDAIGREVTDEIVRQYESEVQSIRLSELMTHGCGPGCGSDAGGGCGSSGGCATCSVACGVKG